jgi:hypothetical protein
MYVPGYVLAEHMVKHRLQVLPWLLYRPFARAMVRRQQDITVPSATRKV